MLNDAKVRTAGDTPRTVRIALLDDDRVLVIVVVLDDHGSLLSGGEETSMIMGAGASRVGSEL